MLYHLKVSIIFICFFSVIKSEIITNDRIKINGNFIINQNIINKVEVARYVDFCLEGIFIFFKISNIEMDGILVQNGTQIYIKDQNYKQIDCVNEYKSVISTDKFQIKTYDHYQQFFKTETINKIETTTKTETTAKNGKTAKNETTIKTKVSNTVTAQNELQLKFYITILIIILLNILIILIICLFYRKLSKRSLNDNNDNVIYLGKKDLED
jgi:hypothetical protein